MSQALFLLNGARPQSLDNAFLTKATPTKGAPKMEKVDGNRVLMLTSYQAGILAAHNHVGLRLHLESLHSKETLELACEPELIEALIKSLQESLQRLQSIQ